jgi:DNA-binding NarL/FixJ family response regulator
MLSAKGRAPNAKMPITERKTVLRLLSEGVTHKEIAARYGVHFTAVNKALAAWERATGSAVEWGDAA